MTMEFGGGLMQLGAKTVVVEAWGEMDFASAADFDRCLDTAFVRDSAEIVLGLRRVTFADSSAANRLGVAACRAAVDGRRLTVGWSPCLRRVLVVTGTARLLTLHDGACAKGNSV